MFKPVRLIHLIEAAKRQEGADLIVFGKLLSTYKNEYWA
jgi:hypothetical protein